MMGMINGSSVFLETFDPNAPTHLEQNYALLAGSWPETDLDAILVVDEFNRINISVLRNLGFDVTNLETIHFDDIIATMAI